MSDIKTIIKTIEDAVDRLTNAAAARQEPLMKSVLSLLKNLETKGDNLLNSMANLKTINEIKSKVERIIIDGKYKDEVKAFVQSYNDVQELHNEYFAKFNEKFKPNESLNIIRRNSIQTALNGLTETGVEVGVTDGLRQMLYRNIGAGGSYADMTEQVRNYLLTNDTGEGALERHVKTFAITSINTFSAEYNKAVADDLGLEWYQYEGSLLTTSRAFCIKAVEKKYIHVSEFDALLDGDFGDLGKIPVSSKTGLPAGLMKGTNKDNLVRRRGGWTCGHQMLAVSEVIVPKSVRETVEATAAYKRWKK